MNAYYEEGATHNDHHKEMNIQVVGSLSTDAIEKLIAGFMGDETCQGTAQEVQTTDFCPSDVPEEQTLSKNGEASANDDSMPREFSTARAKDVFQGLQRIGLLDADFQPIGLSWAERGYFAQQIAYKLNIEHQWKAFAKLWHCDADTLRSAYNRAKDMPKMAAFDEKIKEIIR